MLLNSLVSKIASRISDSIDGDTVLLIEQYLAPSLNRVCKLIAEKKPKGHEKLLKIETFSSFFDYKNYYKVIDLTYDSFITTDFGNLYQIELEVPEIGDFIRMEQCNSFIGLRLADRHEVPYYMVKEGFVYFQIPTVMDEHDIKITHYFYATIEEFPDELEEYLIDDMLQLVQPELNKQLMEGDIKAHIPLSRNRTSKIG